MCRQADLSVGTSSSSAYGSKALAPRAKANGTSTAVIYGKDGDDR